MSADLFVITPTCPAQARHVRRILHEVTDTADRWTGVTGEHLTNAQLMIRAGDITDHGRWTLTASQLFTLGSLVFEQRIRRSAAQAARAPRELPCMIAIEGNLWDAYQSACWAEIAKGCSAA